jgi:hypothetical protein
MPDMKGQVLLRRNSGVLKSNPSSLYQQDKPLPWSSEALLRGRYLMESAEFKRIDKYIEDVEQNIERLPVQNLLTERHLTKLHLIIERLKHISVGTKNQQLKTSLDLLEHRARKCMQCVRAKHAVKN